MKGNWSKAKVSSKPFAKNAGAGKQKRARKVPAGDGSKKGK